MTRRVAWQFELGDKLPREGWKLIEFAKLPDTTFRERVSSIWGVPSVNLHAKGKLEGT